MSNKILGAGSLAVAILLVGVLGVGSGSADPGARASVSFTPCDISGKQTSLGASYVTSLKVDGVTCAKGETTIKAYHRCRKANGGAVCTSPGKGFKCKEGKRVGVPGVQYSATVKCKKGSKKRVKSAYTQNT
ncbi:MAG: hypothetical protein M3O25_02670 [Actinomycetota bacterium]|nr:hypothetical protein [Actinomycetota bacterium]